jgi:fructokinase
MTVSEHAIGVDLGGTKIEAVVVRRRPLQHAGPRAGGDDAPAVADDADQPHELARARVATNRTLGYQHVVEETRAIVYEVAGQAGIDPLTTPIGVGMPGATTMRRPDGTASDVVLVKNSNTTCLNGQPFHRDLARAIGRPVSFANDANCFALAEATWGAARGARVTFGVIMGTGVGGGLVIASSDRAAGSWNPRGRGAPPRVWEGAQGIAGEWGHVTLEPERGPQCYCGRRGCVETYLSGPAMEAEYTRRTGTSLGLAKIGERAASTGDPIASELIAERIEIFGRALAMIINVVDPDVIVLGGGVSNLPAFYVEGARAVGRWIFSDEVATSIVKHALGDSAGVLGAALLPPAA